jgi:hypothetical protein
VTCFLLTVAIHVTATHSSLSSYYHPTKETLLVEPFLGDTLVG